MKQRISGAVLVLVAFLCAPQPSALWADDGQAPHGSMTFCYQDIELYPNYTGNSGAIPTSNPGINVELVELAAKQAGLMPIYVRNPWKRCLALMKLGRVDSVIASYRADRTDAAVYPMAGNGPDNSKLITLSGYFLYQKRGATPLWDGSRFTANGTIGAPLGYSITAELREQGLDIVEAGTTEGLLLMLAYDRLDAVAAPGAAADTLLRTKADTYGSLARLEAPLKINHYFIAFSHQFYARDEAAAKAVWQASPRVYHDNHDRLDAKYALPVADQATSAR